MGGVIATENAGGIGGRSGVPIDPSVCDAAINVLRLASGFPHISV
jgi:hypothetical protein